MSKAKTGCVAALIVAVPAIVVGGFGYLAWKSGKIPAKSSPTRSPKADEISTCREFAELLQSKEMDIRWVRCERESLSNGTRYPAIYIVIGKDCTRAKVGALAMGDFDQNGNLTDRDLDNILNYMDLPVWTASKVVVNQLPTKQEAEEAAGAVKTAFTWGRFVVSGSPELVEEIRRKLR